MLLRAPTVIGVTSGASVTLIGVATASSAIMTAGTGSLVVLTFGLQVLHTPWVAKGSTGNTAAVLGSPGGQNDGINFACLGLQPY